MMAREERALVIFRQLVRGPRMAETGCKDRGAEYFLQKHAKAAATTCKNNNGMIFSKVLAAILLLALSLAMAGRGVVASPLPAGIAAAEAAGAEAAEARAAELRNSEAVTPPSLLPGRDTDTDVVAVVVDPHNIADPPTASPGTAAGASAGDLECAPPSSGVRGARRRRRLVFCSPDMQAICGCVVGIMCCFAQHVLPDGRETSLDGAEAEQRENLLAGVDEEESESEESEGGGGVARGAHGALLSSGGDGDAAHTRPTAPSGGIVTRIMEQLEERQREREDARASGM